MTCARCGEPMTEYAAGDGGTYHECTCKTAKPPSLADLVALAVGAADKGEEVPAWHEAAKWAVALHGGGDAALAFVRWLDEEQDIVLCARRYHPDIAVDDPKLIPLAAPPDMLLAIMMGVDLDLAEKQRQALAAWWRAR